MENGLYTEILTVSRRDAWFGFQACRHAIIFEVADFIHSPER